MAIHITDDTMTLEIHDPVSSSPPGSASTLRSTTTARKSSRLTLPGLSS